MRTQCSLFSLLSSLTQRQWLPNPESYKSGWTFKQEFPLQSFIVSASSSLFYGSSAQSRTHIFSFSGVGDHCSNAQTFGCSLKAWICKGKKKHKTSNKALFPGSTAQLEEEKWDKEQSVCSPGGVCIYHWQPNRGGMRANQRGDFAGNLYICCQVQGLSYVSRTLLFRITSESRDAPIPTPLSTSESS